MNFSSVVNNLTNLKLRGTGQNFTGKISDNAPLATLLTPVLSWYNDLKIKLGYYDALALGFSSVESVADYYSSEIEDTGDNFSSDTDKDVIIPITEDEASAMLSAVKQVEEQNADVGSEVIVTATSGLAYCMHTDGDVIYCRNATSKLIPVLWFDSTKISWKMRVNWPSTSSSSFSEAGIDVSDSISSEGKIADDVSRKHVTPRMTLSDRAKSVAQVTGAQVIEHNFTLFSQWQQIVANKHLEEKFTIFDQTEVVTDDIAPPYVVREHANDSFLLISDGLVQSGTINGLLCDSIDSVVDNTTGTFFGSIEDRYNTAQEGVKLLASRLANSFKVGGLRGLLLFIIRLMKSQASATDEDGIMVFVDNKALIPREFIVGVLSAVIGSIGAVVGLVAGLISPVVGMVVSAIGSLAWSVIGSAKSAESDSKSSIVVPIDEHEELSMVPYSPIAFLRGDVSVEDTNLLRWFVDFYKVTNRCAIIDVPGGALFVGPGAFTSSGEVSRVRFQFHPFAHPVDSNGWIRFQALVDSTKISSIDNDKGYCFDIVHPKYIHSAWQQILHHEDEYDILNNAADGTLSSAHDKMIQASNIACTGVFVYWLCCVLGYERWRQEPDFNSLRFYGPFSSELGTYPDAYHFNVASGIGWTLQALGALASLDAAPSNLEGYVKGSVFCGDVWHDETLLNWKNITSCLADVDSVSSFILSTVGYFDSDTDNIVDAGTVLMNDSSITRVAEVCSQVYENNDYTDPSSKIYNWNIGNPTIMPNNPLYVVHVPTINRSTFWKWSILAIAVSTAVTVTAVVGAVKFNKWRKTKQFENTVKANKARDEATNALNGTRKEWNPETEEWEEVEFDVNSPEGQAYINSSIKSYKKVCRKNNMMSNLIGGTRYDYTSFYGDAAEEASDSGSTTKERLDTILYGGDNTDGDLNMSNSQVSLESVIHLIKS